MARRKTKKSKVGSSDRPEYITTTTNLHGPGDPSLTGAVGVDAEPSEVVSRNRARNVFLHELARLCPEALDELEPLPPEPGKPHPSLSPEAARSLDEWLARWHIQAEWIRSAAYISMTFWYYYPHERRVFQLLNVHIGSSFSGQVAQIDLGDPTRESRAAAMRRAHSELQANLDAAWDAMIEDLSAKGFRKHSAEHSIHRHTEWLIRYLLKRDIFSEIARDEKVDIKAVSRAVKKRATLIDLPLRS